ncbi:hypothetical protein Tco_0196361 [Tanacetum coccineum]
MQDDDQEPFAGIDRGSKRRRSGKEPSSTSAPSETTTTTAGKIPLTGSKENPPFHKKSASQSAPVEEAMQTTNVFEAQCNTRRVETVTKDYYTGCRLRAYQIDRRLSAQLNVESNDSQIRQIRPLGNLTLGQKQKTDSLAFCKTFNGKSARTSIQKDGLLLS